MAKKKQAYRTFGQNVRRLREKAGWTQEELAWCMGIHKSSVSHYERDQRDPQLSTVIEFCRVLGVKPNVLIHLK